MPLIWNSNLGGVWRSRYVAFSLRGLSFHSSEYFDIIEYPVETSIFHSSLLSLTTNSASPVIVHRTNYPLQSRTMRDQIQSLPFRLFLRCQRCSNLALVKFLQKSQFSFLDSAKYRHKNTQWMFRTTCRRCKEIDSTPNVQITCDLDENYVPIDQVAPELLSRECVLVALHHDLMYFF